ncbi:hypothetical protein GCM10025865_03720 [Paraoerskovia sediminicola]|uniref:Uncharacterized protein n=1 Tax=Paraoerskovia sediminicola TaxID=1138587 RepID=A0ABN6XA47_9CELL|nr:DUF6350 family protein [Paraoerskovia sediminicola]BDZ41073.1 hypothetical protein GCM10025865_03720 [Paraoerskovia sediminicola]
MSTTTGRPPARPGASGSVIDPGSGAPRDPSTRRERLVATFRHGSTGVAAAVQALALTFALVALPAVIALLSSSDADPDGWANAVAVAGGVWLLAHGVPWTSAADPVTLVPLGLTFLVLVAIVAAARRTADATVSAWVSGTVTYALVAAVIAATTVGPGGSTLVLAVVAGAAVGGAGLAAGVLSRPGGPSVRDLTLVRRVVSGPVLVGLRAALVAVGLLVVVAALVTTGWAIAGRSTSGDIVAALAPGVVGGVILAVGQVFLVPNLVSWAVAWLAGPGFVVGSSSFAPGSRELGPLPAVPMLGGLPGTASTGALLVWVPVVVVACGALAGVFLLRSRLRPSDRWIAAGVATAGAAVSTGVVLMLGGGAVGPGAMATVGAPALLTGAVVGGEVALGLAVVLGVAAGRSAWGRRTAGRA